MRLTTPKFWENLYDEQKEYTPSEFPLWLCDRAMYEIYGELKKLDLKDKKLIEIGCMPLNYIIDMFYDFGIIPYGVDYTDKGVRAAKRIMKQHYIPPDQIIKADFLDKSFQEKYKETFDFVLSRGFIEHFIDVDEVVEKHANILKDNEIMIFTVPNLKYMQYLTDYKKKRKTHNMRILEFNNFRKLFKEYDIITLKPIGVFSFNLVTPRFKLLQVVLNILYKLIPFNLNNKATSPYFMCICKKKNIGEE